MTEQHASAGSDVTACRVSRAVEHQEDHYGNDHSVLCPNGQNISRSQYTGVFLLTIIPRGPLWKPGIRAALHTVHIQVLVSLEMLPLPGERGKGRGSKREIIFLSGGGSLAITRWGQERKFWHQMTHWSFLIQSSPILTVNCHICNRLEKFLVIRDSDPSNRPSRWATEASRGDTREWESI